MLLMIIVAVVPTVIAAGTILGAYRSRAISNACDNFKEQCEQLSKQFVSLDYISTAGNETIDGEISMLAAVFNCRILIIDDNYKVVKDTYELETGMKFRSDEIEACFNGEEMSVMDSETESMFVTMAVRSKGTTGRILGVIAAYLPIDNIINAADHTFITVAILIIILIVVIILFGAILSSVLVAPFKKLSRSINPVTGVYEPIHVDDCLESEQISNSYNRLIKEVNALNESRNDFVANVSHELKTPLTSMKLLSDTLTMNPNTSVEEYREFMLDISSEIDRENKIISELLSLVNLDAKTKQPVFEKTDINEVVKMVVNRLQPIADEVGVELIYESFTSVTAEVEPSKFLIIVTNLIENAIKYNRPENGWVHIALNADPQFMYLSVADNGIGIPEEDLDNIYDRFYRVDKSHSKEIGGNGLGLSITKSAISLHNGAITVESKQNEGTTFMVRIPLVHIV